MSPEQTQFDTFYFAHPVMDYYSYTPESYSTSKSGVSFDIVIPDKAIVRVSIPWSNIVYAVESQHWLAEDETVEGWYEAEHKRQREADAWRYSYGRDY